MLWLFDKKKLTSSSLIDAKNKEVFFCWILIWTTDGFSQGSPYSNQLSIIKVNLRDELNPFTALLTISYYILFQSDALFIVFFFSVFFSWENTDTFRYTSVQSEYNIYWSNNPCFSHTFNMFEAKKIIKEQYSMTNRISIEMK